MDGAAADGECALCMGTSVGYRLVTPSGERIGKVCAELDGGYVIAAGGRLRRTFRVLPKEHAWADELKKTLRLTVPRERLLASPAAQKDGAVDGDLLRSYWQRWAADAASRPTA